jgi:hypothetical protein
MFSNHSNSLIPSIYTPAFYPNTVNISSSFKLLGLFELIKKEEPIIEANKHQVGEMDGIENLPYAIALKNPFFSKIVRIEQSVVSTSKPNFTNRNRATSLDTP